MTFLRAILASAVAVGLVLPPFAPVYAQTADAGTVEEGQNAEGSPEDNWLKVCDELEDGRQACIMRQVVTSGGVFTGSFLLRDDPSQESRLLAVAAVPLGVLLPFGLTWQIDGGKPVRVPYMVCDPQSCAAQLVINEAYIQSLKRGATLKLTAKNRRNEDITININLAGFTAVYDSEDALTIEELNAANSSSNVLEQVLQDRAEEMRQQIGSEGGETPPPAEGDAPAEGAAPAEGDAQ
ncbi:invasion associated locus B family protein [Pelagibacterium xiamenense]|uniref:invasion associated locus B family protein n=1 Tax=Pelagibacterium xiamenense TaxID=2901140 RepID=UPI001E5432FF|nr:invasion associated locus B family protein [Pelagibacterium xiamenense]MCD7061033.1 invasion associated locus B family protein [Pelagibacterium xiamenense]